MPARAQTADLRGDRSYDEWAKEHMERISSGMPHLRSLGLPLKVDVSRAPVSTPLQSLKLLERVVAVEQLLPVTLLSHLPRVRAVELWDLPYSDCNPYGKTVAFLVLLGTLSLDEITIDVGYSPKILTTWSKCQVARNLRVLRLPSSNSFQAAFTPKHLEAFLALEELELRSGLAGLLDFGHAPALRILSIMDFQSVHPTFAPPSLSNSRSDSPLSARLEYLYLNVDFGTASLLRIMNECTSLLGLDIVVDEISDQPSQTPLCQLNPLTEDEWKRDAALSPEEIFQPDRREIPLAALLMAPVEFRRRLIFLRLNGRSTDSKETCEQVLRRYPRLVATQLCGTIVERLSHGDDAELSNSSSSSSWLPLEMLGGSDSTSDAISPPVHARDIIPLPFEEYRQPLHYCLRESLRETLQFKSNSHGPPTPSHRRPLLHWLRELKLRAGLPLTPSEARQQPPRFERSLPWRPAPTSCASSDNINPTHI